MTEYYSDLCKSCVRPTVEEMDGYLAEVQLPSLLAADQGLLVEPFNLEECVTALASMPNDKAPGVDGMLGEVYKNYKEMLLPALLEVYGVGLVEGELPRSMREAIIVVLPKQGKDPVDPASYRQISLLTTDIKILAKMLANHLNKVITTIIHRDKSRFIPNSSTAHNLRRLFLMQAKADNVGRMVMVSLYAAKAFDSVEWRYLWAVLEAVGFGEKFISWVQLLYASPRARKLQEDSHNKMPPSQDPIPGLVVKLPLYQSPNKPTIPQDNIHPLTSLDHPQSPFYDPEGGPIIPVARVAIERIARKGEQCNIVPDNVDDIVADLVTEEKEEGKNIIRIIYASKEK
ncbi:unnamed protein product [Ranitomeya imitator]|uniref:Reverse transcriptase domain-containing protein n=1 Tax=Ranitomeya imitator TaxID=111125 RepID=A0ABN9KNT7_9NEOB|nr:unnamed protein product [Ranitomeya imitator]